MNMNNILRKNLSIHEDQMFLALYDLQIHVALTRCCHFQNMYLLVAGSIAVGRRWSEQLHQKKLMPYWC